MGTPRIHRNDRGETTMTTNKELVYDKLTNVIRECNAVGLISDTDMKFLDADIDAYVNNIESKEANLKQIEWSLSHQLRGET